MRKRGQALALFVGGHAHDRVFSRIVTGRALEHLDADVALAQVLLGVALDHVLYRVFQEAAAAAAAPKSLAQQNSLQFRANRRLMAPPNASLCRGVCVLHGSPLYPRS